jgi:hypothetical protein
MLGNQRIGHGAVFTERAGCADLISAHQPGVASDISRQYRCQTPFYALARHLIPARS